MGSERRDFLGGFRFFMVAENYCRTKLANKGQVSLAFPPDVSDVQRMPVVHLDANCSDNVVARNQVTDVRFWVISGHVGLHEKASALPLKTDILRGG
jgi:hypothetical protein